MPRSRTHSSIVRERETVLLETSGRAFFRRVCVSLSPARVCACRMSVCFLCHVCATELFRTLEWARAVTRAFRRAVRRTLAANCKASGRLLEATKPSALGIKN